MFSKFEVIADYARSVLLKLRGAQVAPKVRISQRCSFTAASQIKMGHRVVIEPDSAFKLVSEEARVVLEEHVFIGRGCLFDISGGLTIGKGTLLAPGCFVTDHNHGIDANEMIWTQPCSQSSVTIGSDVWLGARSIILPGVIVGDGAVVAAGAVVTKNVAPMTVVAGVPAKFIRNRE